MNIHKVSDFEGEFFKILETTAKSQAAVMTIPEGGDSGPEEIHGGDQIIFVLKGEAEVRIGEERGVLRAGELAVVGAGLSHHIWNRGRGKLFFLTVYAPPAY